MGNCFYKDISHKFPNKWQNFFRLLKTIKTVIFGGAKQQK